MSYHKYKVLKVPPQNGRRRPGAESGHGGLLSTYPFATFSLAGKGCTGKGNSLAMHPSEARPLSAHPLGKKAYRCLFYTGFAVFARVFMALSIYPSGFKECSKLRFLSNAPFDRFSLAMHPSDQNFLKASILRATPAASGGVWLKGT